MLEPNKIYDRLTPIFQDILDDENLTLRPELSARDVDSWDSLRHVRLLVTVEKAFGVRFSTTEIASLENVGELVALIQAKLGRAA